MELNCCTAMELDRGDVQWRHDVVMW